MSQDTNKPIDLEKGGSRETVADDHPEQLQPELPQTPQDASNSEKCSRRIYSTYSKIAKDEDIKMTDSWQKSAKGILIFTGLFSASVAVFLSVSIQDLRPNAQDTSAFYLANIYQILADPTQPQASIPSSLATPPPFSPPRYAVWVNSLWFLSLVISLFCALLATLLQQWARRYLSNTQPARCGPEKRARLRSFFAGGVDKMHVSWAVGSLSILVHLSLFLFFSGLIIFLHNVNHNVYLSVIWCVGIFLTVYGCFTIMPMFLPESPYNTPLTLPAVVIICMTGYIAYFIASFAVAVAFFYGVLPLALLFYLLCKCLRFLCGCIANYFHHGLGHCLRIRNTDDSDADPNINLSLLHRFKQFSVRQLCSVLSSVWFSLDSRLAKSFYLEDAIENPDIFPLPKIDLGILDWSVGALGETEELEKLIEAIPAFLDLHQAKDLKKDLPDHSKFIKSLGRSLGRTLLSNSLSEEDKTQRVQLCMKAVDKVCDFKGYYIPYHLSRLRFDQVPQTIQTAELLAGWCTGSEDHVSKARRKIVASILPHVQKRDDGWITFAGDQFGVQEDVLRDNIARGDNSVLLAILLHQISKRATEGLSSLSRFDILDANPRLQNEFCASWNELVLQAKKLSLWSIINMVGSRHDVVSGFSAIRVLRKIRHLYIALHQGTDSAPTQFSASTRSDRLILRLPSSYPSCNIATHHAISTVPPPTRHDDPKDASPDSSLLASQPIPGGTTPSQKAEGPTTILGHLSLPELPRLAHGSPSSSQVTNLAQIAPQATSATLTSDREFFDRAPLDPNTVRPNKPTLDLPTKQMRETSQTPAATSLTFPHRGPLPVTVTPSDAPHLPSVSVQQLASNAPRDIAAPYSASDITEISSFTHHTFIPNIGATSQASDGEAIVLPNIVSDSHSLPIMMSVPCSGHIPSVLPSSIASAPVHPVRVSRPLGSTPSTLTVPHSQINPHVSSVLDVNVTTSVGSRVRHGDDETRDPNTPIPMEVSLHADQSQLSTDDIARDPRRPGLHRHDQY